MPTFDQEQYDIRFAWGLEGARLLAPICDAIVLVDVLSFTTCVSVAVNRGAVVFSYRWHDRTSDQSGEEFARANDAVLAGRRGGPGFSLSPVTLLELPEGTRIVLPSPNGSTISLSTGATPTFAGCLRNAGVVAEVASERGSRIGVIACGERWKDTGTLRPAIEDEIGAGAIIDRLPGKQSPEAEIARAAFRTAVENLTGYLFACGSGRELEGIGYRDDVIEASRLDVDPVAPILLDGVYVSAT